MNKKGVTMVSLVFYVLSFFVVVSVIGSISIYVTKNMDVISQETDVKYAQNQLDNYLRKFINRKDSYRVLTDVDTGQKYIRFVTFGTTNDTNTIRYYPKNAIEAKGILFLEVRTDNVLQKKLVIANNVVGLDFVEEELVLGNKLEAKLKIRKGEESIESSTSYGIER